MKRVLPWFGWFFAMLALWLLLTYNPVWSELIVGSFAAAVAATAGELVRVHCKLRFWPRAVWLMRAPRIVPQMLRDSWIVFGALFRKLRRADPVGGVWRSIPFERGTDGPRGVARRVLVTMAISATPNNYVVGIDEETDQMLVHQLVAGPPDRASEDILGWL